MNTKIEKVILQNLANDDEFMRKVIPFLKRDYFIENNEKIDFSLDENYFANSGEKSKDLYIYNTITREKIVIVSLSFQIILLSNALIFQR